MSEPYLSIWAESSNTGVSYHPLWAHAMDVFHVFSIINKNKGGKYDRETAFLASMHDLGKATPWFQKKNFLLYNKLKRSFGRETGDAAGEPAINLELIGLATLFELFEEIKSPSQKRKWKELALYVGMHGGVPYKKSEVTEVLSSCDKILGGTAWKLSRKALFHRLEEALNVFPLEANIQIDSQELMPYAGMVAFSDWVASDDAFFPYVDGDISPEEYLPLSRLRAEKAVDSKGLASPFAVKQFGFKELFEAAPRPLQHEIEIIPIGGGPTLTIIEAPTGEGKTDAAFCLAARLQSMKGAGIFVAAPAGVASEGLFERYRGVVARSAEPNCKVINDLTVDVTLRSRSAPGRLPAERPKSQVNGCGVDHRQIDLFMSENGALITQFGIGAIEQVLLSVFNLKYYFLRHFGLARKTVIFDEVSAYDIYVRPLFLRTLEWLRAVGADVVVLSTVLPEAFAGDMIKAWRGSAPELKNDYPKITTSHACTVTQTAVRSSGEKKLKIILYSERFGDAVRRARELAEEGASVAIILNSVKRAQKFYKLLKALPGKGEEIQIGLYHSQFLTSDAEELGKKLLADFGREADRSRGKIIVADRSLEGSLDLDFDCLFTDIAPIDVLMRRSGKLHRFERERAVEPEEPILRVMAPDVRVEGLEALYEYSPEYAQLFVYRTLAALEAKREWSFPKDYRPLIEAVYAPVPPLASEELGNYPCQEDRSAIEKALRELDFEKTKARTRANSSLLPPPNDIWEYFDFGRFNIKDEIDARNDIIELTAKGRHAEYAQRAVLLYKKNGEYFLDPYYTKKIGTNCEIDSLYLTELWGNTIDITEPFLIEYLRSEAHENPFAEREAPLAPDGIKCLILDEDRLYVGRSYVSKYDKAMGLVIEGILKRL